MQGWVPQVPSPVSYQSTALIVGEARPPQYRLLCEPHSILCRPSSQVGPQLMALVIPTEGVQLPFAEKVPWALGSKKGDW